VTGERADRKGRKSLLLEGVAVLAIFALAAAVGGLYARDFGRYGFFHQSSYGPAVMVALGRGFVNPVEGCVPGLKPFLALETRELPITAADVPVDIKTRPLHRTHVQWRYCLYAVGWLWRISGVISWNALTPLYAVLYGLVGAFAYLLFRVLLAWPLALAGSLCIVFSPTNLYFLPHLRDYSKAAPTLAAVFAAGYLIRHATTRARTIVTCLLLGAFLGVMMGFRRDVFMCVWPTLLVLFVFLPGGPLRRLREKAVAAAVLLVFFYAASWPLWVDMKDQGSASGHVVAFGLLPPFDEFLGIGGVDYDLAPVSNDALTYDIVGGYAERRFEGLGEDPLRIDTRAYDHASSEFLREYAKTFPADLLLRCYAAVLQKVRYGPFVASHESRYGATRVPIIERLFSIRFHWLHAMVRLQVPLLILGFVVLSARSARYGLGSAFLVTYYCSYTILQFDLRHHFHLEFLWWLLPLFLCQAAVCAVGHYRRWRDAANGTTEEAESVRLIRGAEVRRAALCSALVAFALVAPLLAARAYQRHSYAALFSQYAEAEKRPIAAEVSCGSDPRLAQIRLADDSGEAPRADGKPSWCMDQRLLMAEFEGGQGIPLTAFFRNDGVPDQFHRCLVPRLDSRGGGDRLRFFLPVYESRTWARCRHAQLDYFEMWTDQVRLLKGIYEVVDADSIPLWFMMTMADNWTARPRYKTLQRGMCPLHFRAIHADGANVLRGGGFEEWVGDVPAGYTGGTESFAIRREGEAVAEGRWAARQEWTSDGSQDGIYQHFGCLVGPLEPSTLYEVIVSAKNPSPNGFLLSAWDVPITGSGQIDDLRPPTCLRYPVLHVVPCAEYSTYRGTFTSSPSGSPGVFLCVEALGASFPATVFWDEWRVHAWPGVRESYDFNLWAEVEAP